MPVCALVFPLPIITQLHKRLIGHRIDINRRSRFLLLLVIAHCLFIQQLIGLPVLLWLMLISSPASVCRLAKPCMGKRNVFIIQNRIQATDKENTFLVIQLPYLIRASEAPAQEHRSFGWSCPAALLFLPWTSCQWYFYPEAPTHICGYSAHCRPDK